MEQRIEHIDTAKGILMVFVVVGHILNYANQDYDIIPYIMLQEFISAFHMPAFFVLSGMLTNIQKWRTRSFGEYLIRKIKTLIVPYFFFESIAILYKCFVLDIVGLKNAIINSLILKPNIGADWFLPALFMAMMLFAIYIKFPKKSIWITISIILPFAIMLIPQGYPWSLLIRALLAFEFLLVGNLLKEVLSNLNLKWAILSFVLTAVSATLNLKFSIGTDFFNGVLKSPLICVVSGICGTYFVLYISKFLTSKFLIYIGNNTLTIMGTHQLVLYTIPAYSSLIWIVLTFVLITVVEAILIILFNRFVPFLVGKRFALRREVCGKENQLQAGI